MLYPSATLTSCDVLPSVRTVCVCVCVQTMKTMSRVMRECWAPLPAARLTILRVKKTLVKLANSENVKL